MISGSQKIFNVVLSVLAAVCILNMVWMYTAEREHPKNPETVRYENPMPGNNPGGSSTGPPPIHKECK